MYKYLCFTILHQSMKYRSCTMNTTQVILSEPICGKGQLWPWPLACWPQNVKVSSSQQHVSMYEVGELCVENCLGYRIRTKVLTKFICDFDLLIKKMYRYISLTILNLCMKYKSCKLKIYCVRIKVLSNDSCFFDLWTPKYIGIFVSPSCIYVWNMKTVSWQLLKLSCQNQSVKII